MANLLQSGGCGNSLCKDGFLVELVSTCTMPLLRKRLTNGHARRPITQRSIDELCILPREGIQVLSTASSSLAHLEVTICLMSND